jgi:hypothetical protein
VGATPLALSVIVPITDAWSEVRLNVESVIESATRSDAEVLLIDGHGDGLPAELGAFVRCIVAPGADVFTMRAVGIGEARGVVIAITEDHCRVGPDWCEQVLEAHARRPGCDAISGAVVNGADERLRYRAHFLLTAAHCLPPLGREVRGPLPIANFSLKRRALPEGETAVGWLEELLMPELVASGSVCNDDRVVAEHVQRLGLARTFAAHFHNGRSTAGIAFTVAAAPRADRAAWVRESLRLPRRTISQVRRAAREKPTYRREILTALPLIALLSATAAIGQVTGVLAGPGKSPLRLNQQAA